MQKIQKIHILIYIFIFLIVAIWSGYKSYEPWLWFLEAGICVIGLLVMIFTYKKFRLTNMTYIFIMIHFIILFIGAHYSYARVPFFDLIKEFMGSDRNNYDKLGHFAQGFVPAMIAREILIRLDVINKKSWIPFLVSSICLAISAFYELIEWWVSSFSTDGADDFLGTQGYIWDTQSDMFCALIGAIFMLLLLSKIQDKQIQVLDESWQN